MKILPLSVLVIAGCLLVSSPLYASMTSTMLEMPDGVRLATDIFLPDYALPAPAVVIRTPYGKGGVTETCWAFVAEGYACVAQDLRGTGASEGEFSVFLHDAQDGAATIEWVAQQDWCDGNVGTFGGSALGIVQYLAATEFPPHLRCMLSLVATPDLYHHADFHGGVFRHSLVVNWLTSLGHPEWVDFVLEHRLWDSWWDTVDVMAVADQITVPTLNIGGWYDIFGQGTVDAYHWLGGTYSEDKDQYLIMGPWTHKTFGTEVAGQAFYPGAASLDMGQLVTSWFAYWLKGIDYGVSSWSKVTVYLMGPSGDVSTIDNVWMELPYWPPPTSPVKFYLGQEGLLSRTPMEEAATVTVPVDPQHPVPTLGGPNLFDELQVEGRPMGAGPYDQRSVEAREDTVEFTSELLGKPLTVMGRVVCKLVAWSPQGDFDVCVRLTDVYPDGRSMLVADGAARASMRCSDEAVCAPAPGEAVHVDVDLWSTAYVFKPGHRIRLVISGTNHPRFEVNPVWSESSSECELDIMVGEDSYLVLPVLAEPRRTDRLGAR